MSVPFDVCARMPTLRTWNVLADCHIRPTWYPRADPSDLLPLQRWPRVLAALARCDTDICCLQEVSSARVDEVRAALAPRQSAHVAHNGEGLLVASKIPFLGVERIQVGRKASLMVTLSDGTRVACVHLTWSGDPFAQPGGRNGLAQLEALLRADPDIVAGDFNALPSWPERELLVAAGFRDVGAGAPTCNVNGWLQSLDSVYVGRRWRGVPGPVDVIFADTPMPSARFPSDHLPVDVRLSRVG